MRVRLVLIFGILIVQLGLCQDQKIADSLLTVYQSNNKFTDTAKEGLLRDIAFNQNDADKKLLYANELINLAEKSNHIESLHSGYFLKGSALRLKGDLTEALTAYLTSLKYAQKLNDNEKIGEVFLAIGDVYSVNSNHANSVLYYNRAIRILRNEKDSLTLGTALLNAGDEYFNADRLDSALLYFQESGKIFDKQKSESGRAYNLGNVGLVYAKKGNNSLAESNITQSINAFERLGNLYPISVYLTYMSDIYMEKGDAASALNYAQRSLQLAQQHKLKEQISGANLKLSELFEQVGKPKESLQFFKSHITYRDSVNNIKSVQKIADLRTNYEVSQKQVEVDLLNQQKRNQRIVIFASIISAVLILILAVVLYRRYHFVKETNIIIEKEKSKSDNLLLNILPADTALELKDSGKVKVKKFESATVLFTDFEGFTKVAHSEEPERLVNSIDYYFKEFDKITSKFGIEKIKTIGDSYMCVGGLPVANSDHAINVVRAAKEMVEVTLKEINASDNLIQFKIRVGIHTGSVVAGIVGTKKWQYDIWGDTVNIASRMESNSESGRINLSETTYQEIKNEFPCEYRGMIEVKNRGSLGMYFLS